MRKIIFILLLLPLFTKSQVVYKWDRYGITGSLKIGGGLLGYANATLAQQDSNSFAEACAWFEAGGDTSKRGILVGRVLRTDSVSTPKKGLIVYEHISGHYKGYNGSSWVILDSAGLSSVDSAIFATHAWVYAQSYATTTQLGTKQNFTDTSTWDATISDVYGYAAPISHTHTISQVTGLQTALDSNAKVKDSVTKWVTRKQLLDSTAAIRADMGSGGGESLDATVAIGNLVTDQNIILDGDVDSAAIELTTSGVPTALFTQNSGMGRLILKRAATGAYIDIAHNGIDFNGVSTTFPTVPGELAVVGGIDLQDVCDVSSTTTTAIQVGDQLNINNSSSGRKVTLSAANITGSNKVATFPNASGTVALTDDMAKGVAIFSGNGSTAFFDISHGLGVTPTFATAVAASTDASRPFMVEVAATSSTIIRVKYTGAVPISGTNNVSFYWIAIK